MLDHRKTERDPLFNEIHIDCAFVGNLEEKETKCILVARDAKTRYSMATVVPIKGMSHEFPAKRFVAFLAEMGMEHCDVVIKHDQEPKKSPGKEQLVEPSVKNLPSGLPLATVLQKERFSLLKARFA